MDSGIGTTDSNLTSLLPGTCINNIAFTSIASKVCLGDGLFFFPNFHIAISSLPFEGLGCQDFKTDPHPDVFSFSLPLKASGLNELEHKWANNRHILSTDTPHVFVHICKFIPTGFSIALTSTWPVLESLNFYWCQKGEVSGPLGALKSQGTSDTPCSGWISNIPLQHTTNTDPREILHKAPELWNVDFKSTPPSYCTWKQLGQKDPGFQILPEQCA